MSDLAEALLDLQRLTRRLRSECPWDREQTLLTIVPHTVEEAYEVADAACADDREKLVDELGDLLFQVYFLSLLLEEHEAGDLATVARAISAKLVRRHPHVFGTGDEIDSAGEVLHRWEEIKRSQEGREGIFHEIGEGLPSTLYARKAQRRAAAIGFDYPTVDEALADLEQEIHELREAIAQAPPVRPEREADVHVAHELGDVLFSCVNVGRLAGADAELALRQAAMRFRGRVETAASLAVADGKVFSDLPLSEQDSYFDRAKEKTR